MRLWLPRVLTVLILPSLSDLAAQFRNIYNDNPRAVSSSPVNVQTLFSVGRGWVCSLSVSLDLITIFHSQVECKGFDQPDNSTSWTSWTFYDWIDSSLYRLESRLSLSPATDTILQLELCVAEVSCASGDITSTSSSCLSYPDSAPSSSLSHYSSTPEGFIFAIAGTSSSSQLEEMTTTTTASKPPEIEPVEAEVSSASTPSFVSSYPEGFIMAFTPEGSSSVSTYSSQAEGFVFAFTNNNQDSSDGGSQAEATVLAFKSST